MHIKKSGSALISSVIVLSLMSLMGALYYKMIKYNIQLQALNYNHGDKYNLSIEEENTIYEFMNKINLQLKEDEEKSTIDVLKSVTFEKIGRGEIKYNSDKDNFIMKYCGKDNIERYRDINYKISDNRVILIPSYVFKEKDINLLK